MRRGAWLFAAALFCACGGGAQMTFDGGGGGSPDLAMAMGAAVADPGTMMAGSSIFIDPSTAPNDTPATAQPEGVATPDTTSGTVLLWITQNMFTATDQVDYAVFKSSAAGTLQLGSAGVCMSGTNVLAKIDLWKVSNGQQVLPVVKEFTDVGGAQCITGMAPLEANTTYLLGFFGGGPVGSYSA